MAAQRSPRQSLRLAVAVQRLHPLLLLAPLLIGGCQAPQQFDDDAIALTPLKPSPTQPARSASDTPCPVRPAGDITSDTRKVSTESGTFSATVVEASLAAIRLKLGLARDRVGCTEALSAIAKRHGAVAAINGCFFDAYSGRSAAGVTSDARLLLVTCRSATIKQLAAVMAALGCRDAMNLDGGASSGLWFRGEYLTTPGRDISNALLVLSR